MTPYQPRSAQTQRAYEHYVAEHGHSFDLTKEAVVREFDHWLIIENRFPYDNMTRINHLLVSREPLASVHTAAQMIKDEYDAIIAALANERVYDACIENFPSASTVRTHHHVHLVAWHNSAA